MVTKRYARHRLLKVVSHLDQVERLLGGKDATQLLPRAEARGRSPVGRARKNHG